jgi:hypothetical protein
LKEDILGFVCFVKKILLSFLNKFRNLIYYQFLSSCKLVNAILKEKKKLVLIYLIPLPIYDFKRKYNYNFQYLFWHGRNYKITSMTLVHFVTKKLVNKLNSNWCRRKSFYFLIHISIWSRLSLLFWLINKRGSKPKKKTTIKFDKR